MYNNTTERGMRHPNAATGGGMTGTHGVNQVPPPGGLTYGQSAASGPAPTTAGHHKHDIINKLDPRVDSTHDRQPMAQTGHHGSGVPEGTYGPHSSRLANALDPRVDSDLDSTRAGAGMPAAPAAGMHHGMAAGGGGMGMGGGRHMGGPGVGRVGAGEAAEGTYGPHASRMANTLDPRVDSDRDRHVGPGATRGAGGVMGATHHPHAGGAGAGMGAGGIGSGTAAPRTVGPHKSDLLNKLDPRVDSKTGAYTGGSGTRGAY